MKKAIFNLIGKSALPAVILGAVLMFVSPVGALAQGGTGHGYSGGHAYSGSHAYSGGRSYSAAPRSGATGMPILVATPATEYEYRLNLYSFEGTGDLAFDFYENQHHGPIPYTAY